MIHTERTVVINTIYTLLCISPFFSTYIYLYLCDGGRGKTKLDHEKCARIKKLKNSLVTSLCLLNITHKKKPYVFIITYLLLRFSAILNCTPK